MLDGGLGDVIEQEDEAVAAAIEKLPRVATNAVEIVRVRGARLALEQQGGAPVRDLPV